MARSDKRNDIVGVYKVEFDFIDRTTKKPMEEEYITPIGLGGVEYEDHDGGRVIVDEPPKVSNKTPYVGELTQHELDWLSGLPGVDYNLCYRFKVTPQK